MSQQASTDPRPHVVMLVGQDIATDTRVRKVALAVARLPVRVTLVCYTAGESRSWTTLGDVDVRRIPVPFRLRTAREERRAARRRPRRLPLTLDKERADQAKLRLRALRRQVPALAAPRQRLAGLRLKAASAGIRVRTAAGVRIGEAQRLGWAAWDKQVGRTGVAARWTKVTPEFLDYELVLGPVIDQLDPDLIHAHDVQMMDVAAAAVARAAERGKTVRWIYDAHEWVNGLSQYGSRTRRVVAAMADLEEHRVHGAERVITVSEPLAAALQERYSLPRTPDLVLNIPTDYPATEGAAVPSVREVARVPLGVPLLVYSGAVQHARGVHTAVEALAMLPEVHLAVVCVPSTRTHAVGRLRQTIERAGLAERVHLLEPVGAHEVSRFLAGADVGLIPLLHFPSHEMALTNKLFEYLRADLPVVVSDCRAQQEFVEQHGVGLAHPAEDAAALAAAVQRVLGRQQEFRARIVSSGVNETYTWAAQEDVLHGVYRDLIPGLGSAAPPLPAEPPEQPLRVPRTLVEGEVRFAVGPVNSAGQAWRWAQVVEQVVPDASTFVLALHQSTYDFPADEVVGRTEFARDLRWQETTVRRGLASWTHVLLESGRPIFGRAFGDDFAADAALLRGNGIEVGLVFHGSDVRDPARHARTHRWSPFANASDPTTARLQANRDRLMDLVRAFEGPLFVTTPDLLEDVPGSVLLPLSVDVEVWRTDAPPRFDRTPVVLHAPSNAALKGSGAVDPLLRRLEAEGVLTYHRLEGVPPRDIPAAVAAADVVLDQFSLGAYGVMAVQAMAAGRLVLAHVTPQVRAAMGGDVPILQASPDDLEPVLRAALADPAGSSRVAVAGAAFVAEHHDGRRTGEVLRAFLGR